MADDRLANDVVRTLSEYLVHKQQSGSFEGRLETLLGQVEVKMSDPYARETFERFRDTPDGNLEANSLRLHLIPAIAQDPEFAKQLATFGGPMVKSARRGKGRAITAAVLAVVALGGSFLLGRSTASRADPQAVRTTVTSTVEHTVTDTATTTSTTESASSAPSSSTGQGIPGDGSTYPKDRPVPLVELPRPNDQWLFDNGSHDVQFKQFSNSLWQALDTCNESAYSVEQQFRLTNFSHLEVKAVGTDSEADPGLTVRFEVFANNDNINPLASVDVAPGKTGEVKQDLPADVFTLTLRMSLTKTGQPCQHGNAVWGEPYVIATGS
jgi:hypothetical protein